MKSLLQLSVVISLLGCLPSDEERSSELSELGSGKQAGPAQGVPLSWSEQIEAVREGTAYSIRISKDERVSSLEFHDLRSGCETLKSLWIETADLQDDDLQLLTTLPELGLIRLPTRLGDHGLGFLSECRGLRNLNVPNGQFTDSGLAAVGKLQHLESLRIGSPFVTDDGLAVIDELPKLRFLHLIGVPITDAGLEHVASKTSLESFYLDGGRATDEGLRSLLRKRPDLHFHKDQKHLATDPNSHDHD